MQRHFNAGQKSNSPQKRVSFRVLSEANHQHATGLNLRLAGSIGLIGLRAVGSVTTICGSEKHFGQYLRSAGDCGGSKVSTSGVSVFGTAASLPRV